MIGAGYKIGNGLGFVGADVIVRAVPHVAFDLQANYLSESDSYTSATGFGIAPTVDVQLNPVGHTPYLGLGLV